MIKRIHPLIVIGLLFVIIIFLTIRNEFLNSAELNSEDYVSESLIQDSFAESLTNESFDVISSTQDYLEDSSDDSKKESITNSSLVDTSSENFNEEFEVEDSSDNSDEESDSDELPNNSEEESDSDGLLDNSTDEESTEWQGEILNPINGVVEGPSGKETYYNLDMSNIVSRMRSLGYNYEYYIRDDGVKMFGPYIMCAANLELRPRGTIIETSLGTAIVCDTGGFAKKDPYHIDIAVNW